MGTARGTTQASCLPRARMSVSVPSLVTVCCLMPMVLVGLNATLITMSSPLEMPPWIPPERFVRVRTCETSRDNGCMLSDCRNVISSRCHNASVLFMYIYKQEMNCQRSSLSLKPRACFSHLRSCLLSVYTNGSVGV